MQEELQMIRYCFLEMTREELDIAILAKLSCGMHLSQLTSRTHKKEQTVRKSQRTDFFHHGEKICRDTFKYLHAIGQVKLDALIKHYKEHGVTPRMHGNKKRQPPNALKKEDNMYVAHFIINYAETHGMHLPGRVPGFWRSDLKLLPTNCTKVKVYSDYCVAVAAANQRVVSVVTFRRIWREVVPFVVTMRPATDLCWTCQKYQKRISEAANKADSEKAELHRLATEHLEKARVERTHYQQLCKDSKANLPAGLELGPHIPCSYEGMVHYSMDFAQQIHYPNDPLQPGPMYFKTPRKCGVFGVACEALPKQVTFLLDESIQTGKGSNCVISPIYTHILRIMDWVKCTCTFMQITVRDKNKNSFVMWYLLWRVLTGRHVSIKMSFLLAGHTKFSCDWCFGLFKRNFRRNKVDCLDDIAQVVQNSSPSGVNVPCLCGREDGTVLVPMYDWSTFLGTYFRKLPTIKSFHHFLFCQGSTLVRMKKFLNSVEVSQDLGRNGVDFDALDPSALPDQLLPKGLDAKRQQYLYNEIREFVTKDKQDLVCPLPQAVNMNED
ncbi:uncharacterized protein LOC118327178 [Morone saxatilis]|uniref:uncharacterized protein LOC118327178 n=1 Tax=Morone saxatilis TaxID=34816 RepID=UPI0015E24738|nr:uncharacterized protein LOC118327178 [Morone saxatilis]